jgi:glucose-1-phosphate adenylyltransferase
MVAVSGADPIYRMDIQQMIAEQVGAKADISISVVPRPTEGAHEFGCVEVDVDLRVRRFLEKPSSPPAFPGAPGTWLVSLGNYLLNYDVLPAVLEADHADPHSRHDLGGDVFLRWFEKLHIHAYHFMTTRTGRS